MMPVVADSVVSPEAIALPEQSQAPWIAIGDGCSMYQDSLKAAFGAIIAAFYPQCYPDAKDILPLAAYYYQQGAGKTADEALPVYFRDAETLFGTSETSSSHRYHPDYGLQPML